MARRRGHGFRLSLSHIVDGEWRAMFMGDPMISARGFGVASTPWRAVQRAAWETLNRKPCPFGREVSIAEAVIAFALVWLALLAPVSAQTCPTPSRRDGRSPSHKAATAATA
jgi:hypothetical protein